MTTAAAIWAEAMAARAERRRAAVAAGKSSPEDAARDAALCALFTQHCVTIRPATDRIMALPVDTVQDLHAACQIAEGIARRAHLDASNDTLAASMVELKRTFLRHIVMAADVSLTLVRARIASAHHAMGETVPAWCRAS